MQKIEIYKNTELIKAKLQRLPEVCETLQQLFNKLNSNGSTVSFEVLMKFAEKFIFGSRPNHHGRQNSFDAEKEITELLKNLAIDANPESLNKLGFKISREKMAELVEVDNEHVGELLTLISPLNIEDHDLFKFLEFDTKSSQVKAISGHAEKIETSLTIYAESEKQIKIAKALLKLIEALNEYKSSCEGMRLPDDIDGLSLIAREYKLDIHRIKSYL